MDRKQITKLLAGYLGDHTRHNLYNGNESYGSLVLFSLGRFHITNRLPEVPASPYYKIDCIEDAYAILNNVGFKGSEAHINKDIDCYIRDHNINPEGELYITVSCQ